MGGSASPRHTISLWAYGTALRSGHLHLHEGGRYSAGVFIGPPEAGVLIPAGYNRDQSTVQVIGVLTYSSTAIVYVVRSDTIDLFAKEPPPAQ